MFPAWERCDALEEKEDGNIDYPTRLASRSKYFIIRAWHIHAGFMRLRYTKLCNKSVLYRPAWEGVQHIHQLKREVQAWRKRKNHLIANRRKYGASRASLRVHVLPDCLLTWGGKKANQIWLFIAWACVDVATNETEITDWCACTQSRCILIFSFILDISC